MIGLFWPYHFHFISPSHAYYTCAPDTAFDSYYSLVISTPTYTYLCMILGIHLNICLGVSDSPKLASDSEAWIKVEPSTENQAYLSEQAGLVLTPSVPESPCKLRELLLSP